MRKNSPTYLKWTVTILSDESEFFLVISLFLNRFLKDKKQIVIPGGCAHGFLCFREATITYLQGGTFDTSQEQVNLFFCDNF